MFVVRGRFAPSPTGRLHLGNARTALLAWLQVRAAGGRFLVRVEDLDRARCRPELVEALWRDLEYLGLTWDEPPVYQSQRQPAYEAALSALAGAGLIYPCYCTRAEVARAASAPHGEGDEGPRYPGTCSALPLGGVAPGGRSPGLRFRTPPGELSFDDELLGRVTQDVARAVGDFVVRRNDGVASYQLAVVVDDAASAVTHVLRADDLVGSTPRQLLLYRALGLTPPRHAHVPLLLGEDRKRLAKRSGAFAVSELRERGVPAARVVGLLAQWCGLGGGEPCSAAELVQSFSLSRVRREPVVVKESELTEALGPAVGGPKLSKGPGLG